MIRRIVAIVSLGLATFTVAGLAQAADPVYMLHRLRPGTVCVSYNGAYWPVSQAVNDWNKSKLNVVRRDSCARSGFTPAMTLNITTFKSTDRVCATTSVGRIDGYAVNAITKINVDPSVRSGCYASLSQRTHVITHEIGHWLGENHGAGGVMGSWSYNRPSAGNIDLLNRRY